MNRKYFQQKYNIYKTTEEKKKEKERKERRKRKETSLFIFISYFFMCSPILLPTWFFLYHCAYSNRAECVIKKSDWAIKNPLEWRGKNLNKTEKQKRHFQSQHFSGIKKLFSLHLKTLSDQ